jgi:hypothetical protein
MVCVTVADPLLRSSLFVAEFCEAIWMAIPGIVECLKDSDPDVRSAAISGLSELGSHGLCRPPLPVVVLIPF